MDTDKRKGLSYVVANYMKLVYANWNKETVSDDTIRQDLDMMSGGLLSLDKDYNFEAPVPTRQPSFSQQPRKNFGSRNFKKGRNFNGNIGGGRDGGRRFDKRRK
jgi:hypothetical protein